MKDKSKVIIVLAVVAVLFFGIVYVGIKIVTGITESVSTNSGQVSEKKLDKAEKQLNRILKEVDVYNVDARKVPVELGAADLKDELPDIEKCPLSVTGYGSLNIEIFSSTEKSSAGTDGWLNEVAEEFNNEGYEINGQRVSVSVRPVASGLAYDYIASGKYVPEVFSPSNELWGEMLEASGVDINLETKRLAGNVAGIVLSKKTYNSIKETYGEVSLQTVTKATADSVMAMGYTNPFASSTGLNFLVATLAAYDSSDPLSQTAIEGFQQFQENVPFVAYTTLQMRDAAKSGALDGMILEYQLFHNSSDLSGYIFTPFGARHDSPVYSLGNLSQDEKDLLSMFTGYCLNSKSQKLATKYGFNYMDDYVSDLTDYDGNTMVKAQELWKDEKDAGRPITAVFVADVSGSMDGEPLNELKSSLVNSAQYINNNNSIGLVSYDSDVYMNLPIGKFDLNQRALFNGAVTDLQAVGGTATYDAVCVAVDMLLKEKEANPDTKLMLFLLSDGEQNMGHSFEEIKNIVEAYEIPVYTIGYNANISELKQISDINEGVSIDADSDDVIYKLKNLFNAQM